LRSG
jgi:hypothetical protein